MQYGRPASTVSQGGWTAFGAATHHEATDEVTPNGDTDYAEAVAGNTLWHLGLSPLADPEVGTGHTLRFTAKSVGGGAGPERLNVGLFAGSTLVVWCFTNLSINRGSYQLYEYPLPETEANGIGSYTDLRARFSVSALGSGEVLRITQVEFEIPDAPTGGQEYFQGAAGTLAPGGLVAKQSVPSAILGVFGSSGTIIKQVTLPTLSGALASVGTLTRQIPKAFAGLLTSSGDLVGKAQKVLSGTLLSSGSLVVPAHIVLSGILASSGTIVKLVVLPTLSGTLASVGVLTGAAQKVLSGGLVVGGTLASQARKVLSGTLTSSGAIVGSARKALAGTLVWAGAVVKQTTLSVLQGALAPTGALSALKVIFKFIEGVLGLGGTLSGKVSKVLGGAITPTGGVVKQTLPSAFEGTLAASGGVTKQIGLAALVGDLVSVGSIVKQILPSALIGTLGSTGAIIKSVVVSLWGRIRPAGDLATSGGGGPILQPAQRVRTSIRISARGILAMRGRTKFL